MRRHAKAIWTLIAVSTIFPELVSGSTPIIRFIHPTTLFFLFLGYGLAVLVVREFAMRLRLTYWGVYLLGFAYAVVNEGFLAKTVLLKQGLPMAQYDHYGYIAGVSFPWTWAISSWHALASVLLPIVFTHWLFPGEKGERWLRDWTLALGAAFLMLLSGLLFFSRNRVQGTPLLYLELVAMMMLWCFVAFRFGRGKTRAVVGMPTPGTHAPRRAGWRIFLLGASALVPTFIVLPALAALKIPVPLYVVLLALEIGFYAWALRKSGAVDEQGLLLFGAGFYAQQAMLGIALGIIAGYLLLTITDVVMIAVFIALERIVGAVPRQEGAATVSR